MATQALGNQNKLKARLAGKGLTVKQALIQGAAADANITVAGLSPGDAIVSAMDMAAVGGVMVRDVQIANADVLLFRATPYELIPAPGAGLAIVLHRFAIVSDDTAGAWTESTDDLVIEYAGGADITAAIEAGGLVGGAVYPIVQGVLDTVVTPEANVAVELFNTGDGEWGGGNVANTMSIRLWYSIVPMAAFAPGTGILTAADLADEVKLTAADTMQFDTTDTTGHQLLLTWVHLGS